MTQNQRLTQIIQPFTQQTSFLKDSDIFYRRCSSTDYLTKDCTTPITNVMSVAVMSISRRPFSWKTDELLATGNQDGEQKGADVEI